MKCSKFSESQNCEIKLQQNEKCFYCFTASVSYTCPIFVQILHVRPGFLEISQEAI